MKVLRSSMYAPEVLSSPDREPVTVIVAERSLLISVEEAARGQEVPGLFVVNDVFEAPDDLDDPHVILKGVNRLMDSARRTEERFMAIAYYWNAMQLVKLAPGGTLVNPRQAPLSAAQLKIVLSQLYRHPDYKSQTITCLSKDSEAVSLNRNGQMTVRKILES